MRFFYMATGEFIDSDLSFLLSYFEDLPDIDYIEQYLSAGGSLEKRNTLRLNLIHQSLTVPEYFLKMWGKVQGEAILEDLITPVPTGPHKGKSVLWFLAGLVAIGEPKSFLFILHKFHSQLKFPHFLCGPEQGEHKNKSALWFLAASVNINEDAFLTFFDLFHLQMTLEHFLIAPEEGRHKGKMPLWFLAAAVIKGKAKAFVQVFKMLHHQMKLKHILKHTEVGLDKGKSVLWLLAAAASFGHSEAFNTVFDNFKDSLTIYDLLITDQVILEGWSVLSLLARQHPNNAETLKAIFQQLSGILPNNFINGETLYEFLESYGLMPFIEIRNEFFINFHALMTFPFTKDIAITIYKEAKKAHSAGYLNAFTYVGNALRTEAEICIWVELFSTTTPFLESANPQTLLFTRPAVITTRQFYSFTASESDTLGKEALRLI